MIDQVRIRLFWKVAIYYGVCFALVLTAGLSYPEWMKYLPFGGLDALQNNMTFSGDGDLVDQLLVTNRPLSVFDDDTVECSAKRAFPSSVANEYRNGMISDPHRQMPAPKVNRVIK